MCHNTTITFTCGHTIDDSFKCRQWIKKNYREKTGIWSRIKSWTRRCKKTKENLNYSTVCLECKYRQQIEPEPATDTESLRCRTWSWSNSVPTSPKAPVVLEDSCSDFCTFPHVRTLSTSTALNRIETFDPFPDFDQEIADELTEFDLLTAPIPDQADIPQGLERSQEIYWNEDSSTSCLHTTQYRSSTCSRCYRISKHLNRNRTSISPHIRPTVQIQSSTNITSYTSSHPVSEIDSRCTSSETESESLRDSRRDITKKWIEASSVIRRDSQRYLTYDPHLHMPYTLYCWPGQSYFPSNAELSEQLVQLMRPRAAERPISINLLEVVADRILVGVAYESSEEEEGSGSSRGWSCADEE